MEISHIYSFSKLKQIFSIKTLDEVIPVTISLDPNRYIPSGSPGIVNKNTLFNEAYPKGRPVSVLFPFSPRTGITPGTCVKIHSKNIYELPRKKLIVGHKVKTIDAFDGNKLGRIRDFVKENTGVTFALFDSNSAVDFFANIPDLCLGYKYSTFFYHHGGELTGRKRSVNDVFVSFISFIDINYCIPIFDHRKVDGMGVYCGFMYEDKNGEGSVLIDALCFVLSNHKENLFHIDGAKIGIESRISTETLKYMIECIKLRSKCKVEKTTTNKSKKADSNEKIYVNVEGELGAYANKDEEKASAPENIVNYSIPTYSTSSTVYATSGSWS